jgi:NAD+ synthase (glutamine-hydrolysing)
MAHAEGFVRVAVAVPAVRVGDCVHNGERLLELMKRAEAEGVGVLLFPELCLTGYTCADLFQQSTLRDGALDALCDVARRGAALYSGVTVVGLPVAVNNRLFNCAAVVQRGEILGLVPKSFVPNYGEFYEARWFAPGAGVRGEHVEIGGRSVPFGTDLLFAASDRPGLMVGVEVCEDLWVPVPPSSLQALAGATLLLNLSASNEVIGKAGYRRQLVAGQSGRCIAAYAYASCGVTESTTDVVFGGHCLVAENGTILAETPRFGRRETFLAADVDLDRLRHDRLHNQSFAARPAVTEGVPSFRRIPFALKRPALPKRLARTVEAHPFVPRAQERLRERCEEIFQTQVAGLATRLEQLGRPAVTIGISGGLDSTLALLVTCKTLDHLSMPRARLQAVTMPGFGTTERTRDNASALMRELGVSAASVDIRALCLEEMRAIGHRPFGIDLAGLGLDEFAQRLRSLPPERRHDLVFENVQARMRTSLLMNAGFVVGTGDLSELALGWCTYNGDHMSMYNPNCSIPKTLVKFLVRWAAENEFEGEARRILRDVVATDISPELLPVGQDGAPVQRTEEAIGPYELHDFFLYHFLRYGEAPDKLLYLASQARFDQAYAPGEIRRWLRTFLCRFFASQFKRSCVPDGPKVGSVSLSPRGDWRMPSDAQVNLWLRRLEEAAAADEADEMPAETIQLAARLSAAG